MQREQNSLTQNSRILGRQMLGTQELADALVRRKAKAVTALSYGTALGAVLAAVARWQSVHTTDNFPLWMVLAQGLASLLPFMLFIGTIAVLAAVYQVLRALRDRAFVVVPSLQRSTAELHSMHMWPVRNAVGPIQVLVESGVTAARGPGRFLWLASYVLWPVGWVWYFSSNLAANEFKAFLVLAIAGICTGASATLLRMVLSPHEAKRVIPTAQNLVPFWQRKAAAESEASIGEQRREATQSSEVTPPIDDGLDTYYQ